MDVLFLLLFLFGFRQRSQNLVRSYNHRGKKHQTLKAQANADEEMIEAFGQFVFWRFPDVALQCQTWFAGKSPRKKMINCWEKHLKVVDFYQSKGNCPSIGGWSSDTRYGT